MRQSLDEPAGRAREHGFYIWKTTTKAPDPPLLLVRAGKIPHFTEKSSMCPPLVPASSRANNQTSNTLGYNRTSFWHTLPARAPSGRTHKCGSSHALPPSQSYPPYSIN